MKSCQVCYLAMLIVCLLFVHAFAGDQRGPSPLGKPLPSKVDLKATQPSAVAALPFSEDFDSGLGSWTVDGFWNIPANPQNIRVLYPDIHPTLVILPEPGGSAYIPMPSRRNGKHW